ncbi:MAG: ribonucleotide reductase N-terminal alpha domain-containing protein, partial [Methermicoccaceae archaeon]
MQPEPVFTENALKVLRARYLLKDEHMRIIETPAQMLERVARAVALAEPPAMRERASDMFYELMAERWFLPNSPTLMNAGTPRGQLSACFVLPVPDSIEGIFDALKHMALIHQSGGGTGFSFSELRPKGYKVKSTGG